MNRNEEYMDLMKELDENVPEVQESLQRGRRRKARKQFLYQPLMGLAAVFALFVLSVNISAPVAKACANIPILRELTKAVTFSKSLRAALENDYVQELNLKQTKDGVTVEVTSMIVDRQKLMVFYRFESDKYEKLAANCTVLEENDEDMSSDVFTTNYSNEVDISNEDIRCAVIDFPWTDMPEKVPFRMMIWNSGAYMEDVRTGAVVERSDELGWEYEAENYYITSVDFSLDLDLAEIPETVKYEVNQTMELDGQKLTVTDIEVYPTYMEINMKTDPENTARLRYLHFYVETEDGERFRDGSVGLTGGIEYNGTVTVGAESPYFYDSKISKLVVTGAEWLEYEKERAYVNLITGEANNLPENVSLKSIQEDGNVCLVFEQQYLLRMDEKTGKPFGKTFVMDPFYLCYDADGNQYFGEGSWNVEYDADYNFVSACGEYEFRLENYPYEEVWLENTYSRIWYADKEVSIDVK